MANPEGRMRVLIRTLSHLGPMGALSPTIKGRWVQCFNPNTVSRKYCWDHCFLALTSDNSQVIQSLYS